MFLKRSFQLLVCSATSEEDLDLKSILSHLKKMCLENPDNKINDSGMCSSSLDSMNYPAAGWLIPIPDPRVRQPLLVTSQWQTFNQAAGKRSQRVMSGGEGLWISRLEPTVKYNNPFFSYTWKWGWSWPCFDTVLLASQCKSCCSYAN